MLANILLKPGKVALRDLPLPGPSEGEILVKIKAALTCGTDLKAFKRGHPVIPMPGVFGHEFSGIVAQTGKGVRKFKAGDEIMAVHSAPCMKCRYCKKGLHNLCENIMYTKILGAFAEYILLPSHIVRQNAFLKPRTLSFEEAAFLEPLSCVVHGMESLNIRKGDQVLVIGSGPIGLLHLLLLKTKGARVAVMDKHVEKLRMAKKLGADFVLKVRDADKEKMNGNETQMNEVIPPHPPLKKGGIRRQSLMKWQEGISTLEITPLGKNSPFAPPSGKVHLLFPPFWRSPSSFPPFGKGGIGGILRTDNSADFTGFDYVFECTGMPEVWEASVNYVRRGGTVILFGGCKSGARVAYDAGRLHYDEITLKGVFHYTLSDVRKAYRLLSDGKIKVSPLISGSYPLRQTQKAFERLSKGIGIKYAIVP